MKDKIIKIFYPTNLMVKKIVPSAKLIIHFLYLIILKNFKIIYLEPSKKYHRLLSRMIHLVVQMIFFQIFFNLHIQAIQMSKIQKFIGKCSCKTAAKIKNQKFKKN